jgi:hypothetical protein
MSAMGPGEPVSAGLYALPLRGLVTVAQVSTVWQVKTHKPVVGPHDGLVYLQVGWATAQALYVDTPLLRVQTKRLQSALLAQQLNGINVLVSTVVTGTGIAFRVLVGHGRAESIEDGARSDILRGNEENRLALTLDFLFLCNMLGLSKLEHKSLTMI